MLLIARRPSQQLKVANYIRAPQEGRAAWMM